MVARFASTKKVLAICDVCGFQYKLRELRNIITRGRDTNIKACPECWEEDHPQNELGKYPVHDPQAIQNPRPDFAELASSRNVQYGWNPVGRNKDPYKLTPNNLVAKGVVGSVTVTTT
jgi:hypothetical protein